MYSEKVHLVYLHCLRLSCGQSRI